MRRRAPGTVLTIVGVSLMALGGLIAAFGLLQVRAEPDDTESFEEVLDRMKQDRRPSAPPAGSDPSEESVTGTPVYWIVSFVVFLMGCALLVVAHRRGSAIRSARHRESEQAAIARDLTRAAEESGREPPDKLRTEGKQWKCPNCKKRYSLHDEVCPHCGMHRREARRRNPRRYYRPTTGGMDGGVPF